MAPPVVTVLTDFGLRDPFVGIMHGQVLRRCADARLVDLTHHVPPQDVRTAAWYLGQAWSWFPADTVHLVVVDPGVGSTRRALAAAVGRQRFVVPDNGLLPLALGERSLDTVVAIERPDLVEPTVSTTFHGRDVFAPVTGWLAAGGKLHDLGPIVTDPVVLAPPDLIQHADGSVDGCIVAIDHFGNAITNVPAPATPVTLLVGERRLDGLATCYSDAPPGDLIALVTSTGTIELAVVNGSAAGVYGYSVGQPVRMEPLHQA